jgi:hypothetical protein
VGRNLRTDDWPALLGETGPSFGTNSKRKADGQRAEAGPRRDEEAEGNLDAAKEKPVEGDVVPVGFDAQPTVMTSSTMSSASNAFSPVVEEPIPFEIRDGIHRIKCTVSSEALEAVSGLTVPSTVVLRRRSFDRFRTLINAAAKLKLRTLPSGTIGPIFLTSEDLRCVPPEAGVPSFGRSARGPIRPASLVGGVPVSSPTPGDDASL